MFASACTSAALKVVSETETGEALERYARPIHAARICTATHVSCSKNSHLSLSLSLSLSTHIIRMYIHIYIYMYINIHIYIYIHIYTHEVSIADQAPPGRTSPRRSAHFQFRRSRRARRRAAEICCPGGVSLRL